MALITLCDHVIFDYGTFGLYGALLNGRGGEVIQAHDLSFSKNMIKENIYIHRAKFKNWKWIKINFFSLKLS